MRFVVAVLAAASLSLAHVVGAQASALAGRCYVFDRPYFTATGTFQGGPVVTWRTTVLRLRSESGDSSFPHANQMAAIEPISFRADSALYRQYVSSSGWRAIGGDSVTVQWYDGSSGRVFSLAIRGDSLAGEFVERSHTSVVGAPPPAREVEVGVR